MLLFCNNTAVILQMKAKISEETSVALPVAVSPWPMARIIFLPHQPSYGLADRQRPHRLLTI